MKGKGIEYLLHLVTAILFAISMAGCTNSKRAIIPGETAENVALPWLTDGQFTPPARELLDVVRNAQRYGLNPTSYNIEEIEKGIASNAQIGSAHARPAETALTKLFYTFGKDMLNGSLDPKKITVGFEAARERISLHALQESSIRENTVRSALESLLPRHPEYLRLQDALASYRLILRAGGWDTVPWGPELKRGDSGSRVLSLKQRLAASGDLVPGDNIGSQDYDETLELAVRRFQKRHGLESSESLKHLRFGS